MLKVIDCTICPLHTNMQVGPVSGLGLPSAKLMFVGETSSKDEDLLGRPCVGTVGKFFKDCLDRIGIPYTDIYYTNALKCIPKESKDVRKHINTCKRWLWQEIQLVKPKVIVTLGKLPTTTLLSKQVKKSIALRDIVGKEFTTDYCEAIIIPSYHPDYVLIRGKSQEKLFIEILINAKKLKDR